MTIGESSGEGNISLLIRPGVAAVIRDAEGRVLLHRRAVGDAWAPPSGALEPGESLLAGLHRELHEETGLHVQVERLVAVYSDPGFQVVHYSDGRAVHFITCLFACRHTGGSLAGSEEGTRWEWFHPDRLPAPLLPYAAIWLQDALAPAGEVRVR